MKTLAKGIVRQYYQKHLTADDYDGGNQQGMYQIIQEKVDDLLKKAMYLRHGHDSQV